MTHWKLSSKQWDALDELRFSTRDAKVFRNATIILLVGGGQLQATDRLRTRLFALVRWTMHAGRTVSVAWKASSREPRRGGLRGPRRNTARL